MILGLWMAGLALRGQEVYPAAGDVFYSANGSVSFTIGEAITETLSDGTYTLTQGFGQADPNEEIGIGEGQSPVVRILPDCGPFVRDRFILRMLPAPAQEEHYRLYGMVGELCGTGLIAEEETNVRMTGMAAGVYVVVMREGAWKVVKL